MIDKHITHIDGKRWCQKTYGNTYHTVTIYYSDGTSETSKKTYGYDDSYLQTAAKLAKLPELYRWQYRKEHGITSSVSDVARERDL